MGGWSGFSSVLIVTVIRLNTRNICDVCSSSIGIFRLSISDTIEIWREEDIFSPTGLAENEVQDGFNGRSPKSLAFKEQQQSKSRFCVKRMTIYPTYQS
jgi:hypothetical protein